MCGIAGIVLPRGTHPLRDALSAELERLARELRHRGPDAADTLVTSNVGLAHTRLAILDLSPSGAQPMWTPDGRFAIAYNGEVYNFLRLRSELEGKGERFSGRSDTEVVLRLLAREGEAALRRLDGMFALALLDSHTGHVLLARDRSGLKPLYFAPLAGGGFAFASEMSPLLGVPGVDRSLDIIALSHYLTFGFVPAPYSLRKGIRQLLPGHACWLRSEQPPEEWLWAREPGPLLPQLEGDVASLSAQLEELLSAAVRDHLVSDVPVGVLLSGGVDSSTVAALAARHTGRLKTFSMVHRDRAYDERVAARAVAAVISSEHHEIELDAAPLSENELDTLVDSFGDPFADSSALAVLRLSQAIRERGVVVALSGDGGDEVFAGYPRFWQLRAVTYLSRLPRGLLIPAQRACASIPGGRMRQIARTLRVSMMPRERQMIAFTSLFWPEEQSRLLRAEFRPPGGGAALDALLATRGAILEEDPVAASHWLEQRLILPDSMLVKVDRMSMARSLEVRPPLLAGDVLDFAARLPFEAKLSGMVSKRALRAIARRLVPEWVVDRPKRGFALPLAAHGGRALEEASRFALESETSPLRAIFEPAGLRELSSSLQRRGEGRDPEDSQFRRVHRRWALALLARVLWRQGGVV